MKFTHQNSVVACGALLSLLLASSFTDAPRNTQPDETPTAEEITEAGELFSSSCASCHLPPNPDYATDRAWLSQVKDTAWSSTPQKARAALIAYLNTAPLPLPWETAPAAEPLGEELGTLTPSFKRGDLFLVNTDGDAFRLSWTGTEEGLERTRALPVGDYKLQTYRIVREQDDELWHISATRPKIQEIKVIAGTDTLVEVDDEIRIHSKLGHGRAQMGIQGENHAGLSIYRDGQRIPIGYRILDEEGTQLASGSMRYGWGGGGWAPVESKKGSLELVYDEPPFDVVASE